jgi:hypothetical protein
LKQGINVLEHAGYSATPYVAICFAFQVICDACGYLVCQACLRRRRHVRDDRGVSIVQHVVGVDDFESAVATYWAACHRWPKAKITLRQEARIIHKSWEANRLTSAGFGNRVLVGDPLHNSARNGSTIDRFCETAVIVARGSARLPTLQPGATINAGCQLTSVPSAKSAITAKVGSARVDLRGPLSYHTGSFCSSLDADVLRPPNANARQL